MKISLRTTGTRSSHRLDKVPQAIPHTHPQPLQNTDNPIMLNDSGGRKLMPFFQTLHTWVPRFYISDYFTYKLVKRKGLD